MRFLGIFFLVMGLSATAAMAEGPTPASAEQKQKSPEQPDIELMALFRLHEVTAENGEKVTGVWAQVDHRDVRPWVIFLPLLKNEEGKHELGDMVYYATEQPLFEKSGE